MQEYISLRSKTTMKIGGTARYYAELKTKEDVEETYKFSREKNLPLVILGAGSNTIFADNNIDACVIKTVADAVTIDANRVTVQTGKYLAVLINELAEQGLDLSPLTGIPGTIGGAIFGNAGQGFGGTWIDAFVESVEVFDGAWKTFSKNDCAFAYRTSAFKGMHSPFIWECVLKVPRHTKEEIQAEVERLLKKRIETQPHVKTAGSCFLSVSKESPAWKLIDAVGLRGLKIGDVEISAKHANFLINTGHASYEDVKKIIRHIQEHVPEPLHVEMRLIQTDGTEEPHHSGAAM